MTRQTPLGNRYALTALRKRRADLAGEITFMERQIAWRKQQLAYLDGTLWMMDPAHDATAIKPTKYYRRVHLFKQGQLARLVLDVLRRAREPITAQAITTGVMEHLGFGEELRPMMRIRVGASLSYLASARRGKKVMQFGKRGRFRWAITRDVPRLAKPKG